MESQLYQILVYRRSIFVTYTYMYVRVCFHSSVHVWIIRRKLTPLDFVFVVYNTYVL